MLPGLVITVLDAVTKALLLLAVEEGDFVDFLEVGFQAALGGNGGLLGGQGSGGYRGSGGPNGAQGKPFATLTPIGLLGLGS